MSSQKPKPNPAPKAREYNVPSNPEKILSMAYRYGIAPYHEIFEFQDAVESHDTKAYNLFMEFIIPYYRDYLKTLFVEEVG